MERHFSALYPAEARFEEIKKVLGFVQAGNISQILGVPGVGRTVFLGLLAFNKKVKELHLKERAGGYHFVLVDFTALKEESLSEVAKTILLSLFQSLQDRKLLDEAAFVEEIFRENNTDSDIVLLFQGIHRAVDYLAHEKDLSIIFLFDSFEVYAPHLDPKFFNHLTALRDHMRYKLSFIFSLNRPLEVVVDNEYTSVVNQLMSGHALWLFLSDEVSNHFLKGFLEKQFGKKIDDALYRIILEVTGGHAKLVKVSLEESLQNEITAGNFLAFAKDNKAIRSVCYEIWNSFHADEQIILKDLAVGKSVQTTSSVIYYLTESQMITHDFSYTIALFQDFVGNRADSVQAHTFSYRKDTNDLLKGDTIISENFTATEFRLLSYLVQQADQIIDREALIAAAWKDAKSTAGVSEQALDQLIYRLRKKIEEDPNSPSHILTIKGRGVKFAP